MQNYITIRFLSQSFVLIYWLYIVMFVTVDCNCHAALVPSERQREEIALANVHDVEAQISNCQQGSKCRDKLNYIKEEKASLQHHVFYHNKSLNWNCECYINDNARTECIESSSRNRLTCTSDISTKGNNSDKCFCCSTSSNGNYNRKSKQFAIGKHNLLSKQLQYTKKPFIEYHNISTSEWLFDEQERLIEPEKSNNTKKLHWQLIMFYSFLLIACGAFVIWISNVFYRQYRLSAFHNASCDVVNTSDTLFDNKMWSEDANGSKSTFPYSSSDTNYKQKHNNAIQVNNNNNNYSNIAGNNESRFENIGSWSNNGNNSNNNNSIKLNTNSNEKKSYTPNEYIHSLAYKESNTNFNATYSPKLCSNVINTVIHDNVVVINANTTSSPHRLTLPSSLSAEESSESSLQAQSPLSELAAEEEADKQRVIESVLIANKVNVVSAWLDSLPENCLPAASADNAEVATANNLLSTNKVNSKSNSNKNINIDLQETMNYASMNGTKSSNSTENTFERVLQSTIYADKANLTPKKEESVNDAESSTNSFSKSKKTIEPSNENYKYTREDYINSNEQVKLAQHSTEANYDTNTSNHNVLWACEKVNEAHNNTNNINNNNNDDDSENVNDDDDDKQKSAKCIVVNNTEAIEEVQKVLASPIAGGYNDEYQERMRTMTRTLTSDEAEASPFIGFSLAQYASSKTLVVDGLFRDGPAYQTGIRIGDNLLCIADIPVETIEDVRNVVAKYCHCGRITDFTLRHPLGDEYTVQLWIMTVDPQFAGQPFFFDVNSHVREESPSRKRYVVGSDELEEIIHVTPNASRRRASEASISSCPELLTTQLFNEYNDSSEVQRQNIHSQTI